MASLVVSRGSIRTDICFFLVAFSPGKYIKKKNQNKCKHEEIYIIPESWVFSISEKPIGGISRSFWMTMSASTLLPYGKHVCINAVNEHFHSYLFQGICSHDA
jgi:hypothetical protein